jgi:hypothetical protein
MTPEEKQAHRSKIASTTTAAMANEETREKIRQGLRDADPSRRARQAASLRKRYEDPAFKEQARERGRLAAIEHPQTLETREKKRQAMKKITSERRKGRGVVAEYDFETDTTTIFSTLDEYTSDVALHAKLTWLGGYYERGRASQKAHFIRDKKYAVLVREFDEAKWARFVERTRVKLMKRQLLPKRKLTPLERRYLYTAR